ncbi:MAG TPA: LLM class flavin-dependent oxidoreductase [Acidimicrobiales bacterium]|nr:LLM class flavin-dependent oxidoreductase [Acidimicrobiales bacterium]
MTPPASTQPAAPAAAAAAAAAQEFFVFLPQMRMDLPTLVGRARAAEAAGFTGLAGMDHLVPPGAEAQPMYEAMVANTWLAAHTDRLVVGSLVLCDSFRHPAVLAREAVSIDHASGGRFELGIGWGSVAAEIDAFGIGSSAPADRVARLAESLDIIKALWAGDTVDYDGRFFRLRGARQAPGPLGRIPVVIGGAGPKTMALVAAHADWWNVHVGIVDKLDDMRPLAGRARCSVQVQVALVPDDGQRDRITEVTRRRFGPDPVIGTAAELVDHFGRLAERGVERSYVWFCDFAHPDTLAAFGDGVIGQLSR